MKTNATHQPCTPKTSISVKVNEQPVNFTERKVTGLVIKQTAIQQGVAIQLDFVLFWVRGAAPLKQIADSETVNLHEGQVFRAVTPDDNS